MYPVSFPCGLLHDIKVVSVWHTLLNILIENPKLLDFRKVSKTCSFRWQGKTIRTYWSKHWVVTTTQRFTWSLLIQGRVFATVARNMFGLRSLVKRFREFGCAAMTSLFWPNVNQRLWSVTTWFQDGGLWKVTKVNYWLKHDGMIVRIQVYLSRLILALTSKFYFAKKKLITPYILRNVDD